jgi:uncharacterized membrane protein
MEPRMLRNIAIIALIAAAVYLIPGGGKAANTFESVLIVGFACGFGYFGLRLYREHRVALHGLGDRSRAMLYGSLALIAFLIVGYDRMVHHSSTLVGVIWFALVLVVLYGLMDVYRRWRSY